MPQTAIYGKARVALLKTEKSKQITVLILYNIIQNKQTTE